MRYYLAAAFLFLSIIPAPANIHGSAPVTTLPSIISIAPTSGGTTGGTSVTVTGTNLASVTAVKFGAATSSFSCTATTCTATSPAGSGTQSVTVVSPSGTSGGVGFLYQNFNQTFAAGTTDPTGHLMDGTELRDLLFTTILNGQPLPSGGNCTKVAGCPTLLGFTGFWEDNACTPGQGPQVLALTSSLGKWYLDTTLTGTTPCGGAQFNVVNSVYDYFVRYDGNGNPVSPSVEVTIAGGPSKIYARNNALGIWHVFDFTGDSGTERAVSDHEDDTGAKPAQYALLGNDSDGIHAATWLITSAPTFAYTIGATGENFCQKWASGTTCTTMCSPNTLNTCTNLQNEWPDQLAVTSGSSDGAHMTLNWAAGSALLAPLSPGFSSVDVVGTAITCTGGTPPSGLQLVTAQTSTSVTFASSGTTCTYTGAVVSTIASVALGWAGSITAPSGSVVITGITGYVGANPNGTQTITYANGTSLQFFSDTDCSACTGGSITTISKTINSWASAVVSNSLPNIRILGLTDCPVTSGGNTAGNAAFLAADMNIWQRVDNGASSFWRIKGVVPATGSAGANWPTGQPQLRGLTCIHDSTKASGYALLSHIEGDGGMWSMDPNTGLFNMETNLISDASNGIQAQWGASYTYGLDAYNSQGIYPITVNGHIYYVSGEGDAGNPPIAQPYEQAIGKETAYSGFWVRSTNSPASASAPGYTVFPTSGTTTLAAAQAAAFLNAIKPTTPIPPAHGGFGTLGFNSCAPNCPLQISTRAGPIVSLFPEDAGQILFLGGFDANSVAIHSTAWVARAPVSMFAWP